MKGKTKTPSGKVIIGVLIFLGLVFAVSKGLIFPNTLGSVIGPGGTILQISEVRFLNQNNPILNDKVWLISTIPGGLSQWIEGQTNTKNTNQFSDGDVVSERNLRIDITNNKQRCVYLPEINHEAQEIAPLSQYSYQVYSKSFWDSLFGTSEESTQQMIQNCEKLGTPLVAGDISPTEFLCVYFNPRYGSIATIPTEADRIYETEVSLTSGVQTYSATLTNADGQSSKIVNLGDVAYVTDVDIASGLACPSSTQYIVYGNEADWKIISKDNYDFYKSKVIDYFQGGRFLSEVDSASNPKAKASELVNYFNSLVSQVVSEKTWCKYNYGCAKEDDGLLYFVPEVTVSNPIIQFYVSADWVGAYQPIGEPKITCLSSTKNIGVDGGSLGFKVENVGSERGNVEVSADCVSPVTQSGGNIEFTLGPRDSKTSSIGIVSTRVQESTTVTCNLRASIFDKTDSCQVRVTVSPEILCDSYSFSCRGNQVVQCNEFGTGYNVIDTCSSTEICQFTNNNKFECVSEEIPEPLVPQRNFFDVIRDNLAIFGFGVLVVGGLIVWKKAK